LTDFDTLFLKQEVLENQNNPFRILSNPLLDHYLPNFIKQGPRSRIFESIMSKEIIDVRDFPLTKERGFPFTRNYPRFFNIFPLFIVLFIALKQYYCITKKKVSKAVKRLFGVMRTPEFKIFLTFFLVYAYFMHWSGWNEHASFVLTAAIIEDNTLKIDDYISLTGDRCYYEGNYYSSKAPGLSFLTIPVFWAVKSAWFFVNGEADLGNPAYFVTQQIFATMISSFFSALSAVIIYLLCKKNGLEPKKRILITVGYGFGTILFSHSTLYSRHLVSASLLLFSFYLLNRKKTWKECLISGVLAGYAITTEYSVLILAGCLTVYSLMKARKLTLVFVVGIMIGTIPMFAYHFLAFGSPFRVALMYPDKSIWMYDIPEIDAKFGFKSFIPNPMIMLRLLFYPEKGLFFYSPVLIASLISLLPLLKKKNKETILALLSLIIFVAIFSQYETWGGGYTFGPRHLSVLIPFLILPMIYNNKLNTNLLQTLLILSLCVNALSLSDYEDSLTDQATFRMREEYVQKQNTFEILANPIFDYYLPNFGKKSPRSWIFESVYNKEETIILDDYYTGYKTVNKMVEVLPIITVIVLIWWGKIRYLAKTLLW
jgi:hypothetical protein